MHRVWRLVQYWGKCRLRALWVALWLPDGSGEGKNGRLACRWLDVDGVARGQAGDDDPSRFSHSFHVDGEVVFAGGLIEEIKKVELIGPRREIWREGVSALACTLHSWLGTAQDSPTPSAAGIAQGAQSSQGPLGNLKLLMKKISIQHPAFSISTSTSTSISMREGQTLDAVGSWGGGKLCSINSHACLCMVYPNRDIPKRDIPNREHEQGQKDCTARTVTRSARIQLGGHLEISISISISISINMFGLGRPFLVAVINQASR
jgi:hypothetical protein